MDKIRLTVLILIITAFLLTGCHINNANHGTQPAAPSGTEATTPTDGTDPTDSTQPSGTNPTDPADPEGGDPEDEDPKPSVDPEGSGAGEEDSGDEPDETLTPDIKEDDEEPDLIIDIRDLFKNAGK